MQTVTGSSFNDVFVPGAANVTIGGCDSTSTSPTACGDDTVSFAGAPLGVTVNLNTSGTASDPIGLATGGWGGNISLVGISNVIGTSSADTITGDGLPGTLIGGGGNDTFLVTGGNDTIDGGSGTNTLSLADVAGQASVNLNDTQPQSTGAAGILTIVGGTIQTLVASQGGSNLYAGTGTVTVVGGPGNDWLAGGTGTQTLEACNAALSSCGGSDVLVGGSGSQTLSGGPVQAVFEPGQGNETVVGMPGATNILSYSSAPAGVLVNLSNTLFSVPAPTSIPGFSPITLPEAGQSIPGNTATGGYGGTVNLTNANITQVFGTPFSDVIVSSTNGGNQFSGGGGNDVLVARGGDNVLSAAPGTLTFFVIDGAGNNLINGGGNGVIDEQLAPQGVNVNLQTGNVSGGFGGAASASGVSSIIGSEFNDILIGNASGGTIIGLNGNDLIEGGPVGGDTLVSGGGGNTTFCASVSCEISGTNASAFPGTAGDVLIGGSGDDTFFVRNGVVDTVIGGSGFNEAQADPNDSLTNIAELLP
jgi:Ca2+-binding RTX toxin-like protein